MSKNRQGRFNGWVVCLVGLSLLSACAGMEDEGSVQASRESLSRANPQGSNEVVVSLSVDNAAEATLTVTLTNTGRHPVKLLKWLTPVDGLEEALFQVTRDGEPVSYQGPHYKRPAPQEKDFLKLAPGESLVRTVELSGFYDLSESGNYSIRYQVGAEALQGVQALSSNEVTVWLEGRVQTQGKPGATTCSSTQLSTLAQALSASGSMVNGAVTYLNGSPSATPRYTTWFGTFSTSGWDTAKTHFAAIKDAIDTKPVTFDCSCKKSYYAYVYPSQPYTIYLCNAFWAAPMTGTDSKGGTLIHELSHFSVVASTDDWAYGQTACKSLAVSDPAKALDNADSHEYFAENTPAQQ